MVSLLLDTYALHWWLDGDPRLGSAAREAILAAPRVAVSAVSAWELALKIGLGRRRLDLDEALRQSALDGFDRLPVMDGHCRRYATLPVRHRDPFGRMLVAQALEENMTLLSGDPRVARYGDLGLAVMPCAREAAP